MHSVFSPFDGDKSCFTSYRCRSYFTCYAKVYLVLQIIVANNMKFILLLGFLTSCNSMTFTPELDEHWENFKEVFGKTYDNQEERARRHIWEDRVIAIGLHNLKADMGLVSYRKGLNKYSDLTPEEFSRQLKGYKRKMNVTGGSTWLPPENIELPKTVDWRTKGYVTKVKDQQDCGSCWAFSATGSLEGQHFRKSGNLVSLSEQNLVDCSYAEGNDGCEGGLQELAFQYIKKNHGIDTEESYPYEGYGYECQFKKSGIGANCTGFVSVKGEKALQKAVATIGPISVCICTGGRDFDSYKSGIFDPDICYKDPDDLDHAVLVVGYGTGDGKDYWIVKNSWGTSWGEQGYIKMVRNKENKCGIATEASYPLV
ncbi:hypothetical protein JTE90_026972 [Oedothorax gibbosus]|uniref:Cathepsin L n=1 Tax=Oedothorax gibbosus TaxID=931172 RepID=A0AAV6TPZ6_9ARAC|nr:hypothetical protein JTE90_026972 [Oedothorax gibbosus]